MKTELYTVYSPEGDMTFIMEDTYENGDLVSVEVVGFYLGKPNEEHTCKYYDKVLSLMGKTLTRLS